MTFFTTGQAETDKSVTSGEKWILISFLFNKIFKVSFILKRFSVGNSKDNLPRTNTHALEFKMFFFFK